ncbi:MAG: hypothetical protein SH808_06460 [Saprospiraceae bacterium]|nr:hypothetical protein [Saprospiraceae bacterium]
MIEKGLVEANTSGLFCQPRIRCELDIGWSSTIFAFKLSFIIHQLRSAIKAAVFSWSLQPDYPHKSMNLCGTTMCGIALLVLIPPMNLVCCVWRRPC